MKYFGEGLSEKHKELSRIIRKPSMLEQAAQLFLEIHASLHLSRISGTQPNEVDALLSDLTDSDYAVMPSGRDATIAWVLGHIARIEDLTMGILAAKGNQLFNEEWQKRLNVSITDTGNALTDDEIMLLSKNINTAELISYRNAVGERTRKIVRELDSEALKRKVSCEDIARIRQEGGVTQQEESAWLLDFWGKKDVAGLLLMPPTRHVMLHLNDCCRWKQEIRTKKKFFRS